MNLTSQWERQRERAREITSWFDPISSFTKSRNNLKIKPLEDFWWVFVVVFQLCLSFCVHSLHALNISHTVKKKQQKNKGEYKIAVWPCSQSDRCGGNTNTNSPKEFWSLVYFLCEGLKENCTFWGNVCKKSQLLCFMMFLCKVWS